MAAKKTIENKTSELFILETSGEKKPLKYFELIRECLDVPPTGGFTREEINKRNKIDECLVGDKAELDHDLFHIMKNICNAKKWPTRHKGVQEFLNYLDDIK